MASHRATFAEIDLAAFQHNLKLIRTLIAPGVKVMAVVKADAYGHGAVPCAKAAIQAGADCLGVAILEEGMQLRQSGIEVPILIMASIFPGEVKDLIHHNLSTTLNTEALAEALARQAKNMAKTASVHLKVDTGMGRLGMPPEELIGFVEKIRSLKNLQVDGIFTHFSSADEEDPGFTLWQISRLNKALEQLKSAGTSLPRVHAANSAAILRFPDSQFDLVRPGIILYGALPSSVMQPIVAALRQNNPEHCFHPVMHWKTKILQINHVPKGTPLSYNKQFITQRDSLIATLPAGYADGLSRNLSNRMQVLVRGQRAPQVGVICMDLCLIDVTGVKGVQLEDEVVFFGKQGKTMIPVDEMAERANTISYEILCTVGKRVPRIYLGLIHK